VLWLKCKHHINVVEKLDIANLDIGASVGASWQSTSPSDGGVPVASVALRSLAKHTCGVGGTFSQPTPPVCRVERVHTKRLVLR
jgi:hypothetical protein